MPRNKCQISFESEEDKQKAFVQDFLIEIHDVLSLELLKSPEKVTQAYGKVLNQLSRKYGMMMNKGQILKIFNSLVASGEASDSFIIESLLKNKSVRSSSGVLPISVATDGNSFSCAYDCHFCPNESVKFGAKRDISRSYLSSEGTFIRGAIEDFDAARSVWRRLIQLEMMGHPPDKCEIIVLGGTWDCYQAAYREEFIREIFYACNSYHLLSLRLEGPLHHHVKEFIKKRPFVDDVPFDKDGEIRKLLPPIRSLQEEKAFNETAPCGRIIGIVLETRPDQITRGSLLRKRKLGCTRIQLGIQSTNDEVLEINNRGHPTAASATSLHLARDACFKVDGHLMPDLPGTTLEIDYKMISDVFFGDHLQLDYCKLYPCLDLPYTKSREWKETGFWKPIAENNYPEFLELMCHAMASVPPWTRVNRVQRDFPEAQEKNDYLGFVSENIKSNLQEEVIRRLKVTGRKCRDIRCREIRTQHHFDANDSARLFIRAYRANEGTEFFITVEIPDTDAKVADDAVLVGLLRLRLPDSESIRIKVARGELPPDQAEKPPAHYLNEFRVRLLSRIRELHVYGNIRMADSSKKPKEGGGKQEKEGEKQAQHTGVGKFLMSVAERISWSYGFNELAVISGVGVRGYYKKLGYEMDAESEGEFMIKTLPTPDNLKKGKFLPLTLFGHEFRNSDIQNALARLQISEKYLPSPYLLNEICDGSGRQMKHRSVGWKTDQNLVVRKYKNIQNEEPQLLILKAVTQPGSVTRAPLSKFANDFDPYKEKNVFSHLFFWGFVVLVVALLVASFFGDLLPDFFEP